MSILRWFENLVSWPVETKRARNLAVLGIRIFVESGLEERLIVKTTVRFLELLVSFYVTNGSNEKIRHIRHQQFVHLVSGFQRFLEVFGFQET